MSVFCVKCGAPNDDLATSCSACGAKLMGIASLAEAAQAVDKAVKMPVGTITVLILCAIYLLNPFFGVDILPDNIPIVGNLDEVGITYLMISLLSRYGRINLPRRKTLPPA